MKKTYSDYIKTGQMDPLEAIKHQTVRNGGRDGMAHILAKHIAQQLPADAAAFGALDCVAVKFVEWYGPVAAGEVFRHYAEVCERQPVKDARQDEMPLPEGGDA